MRSLVEEFVEVYNPSRLKIVSHAKGKKLQPILKWAGGKEQELKYIIPNLPDNFNDYYEPFVGGGAVYTAVEARNYFINDKSEELISLYRSITNGERDYFFEVIDEMIRNWDLLTIIIQNNDIFFIEKYKNYSQEEISQTEYKDIMFEFIVNNTNKFNEMFSGHFTANKENFQKEIKINLIRKSKRMKELEQVKNLLPDKDILDNIETAFKSAYYMHLRHLYNNLSKYKLNPVLQSAIFLFIRNFAYSGMFRYNASGDFNVPYGGIGYNRKNLLKKIDYLRTEDLKTHLDKTIIENLDFEDFFALHPPKKDDFIFLDPPYDSEFSVYFSESIHPVSFQTVQPDQGFFYLGPFHPQKLKAA